MVSGVVLGESANAVYARREDVLLRAVAGEHLLVPVRRDVADMQAIFGLNRIGAYIWELLDGQRTLASVLAAVLDRFDVGAEEAAADLGSFVEQLNGAGIVERRR
ncbi:MAG TPA: PqqD family protein [Vicinamibacteria bacterium]|nr:PqqD family protein [Vicinamibacteria bacterium]